MTDIDSLIDRLAAAGAGRGEAAFIDAAGRTVLTRAEFAERIRQAAGSFAGAGLGPGDPVAFGVRQDAAGVAWLLGALRAGVTVVVLDPGLAPSTMVDRCRAAGTRAVVLDPGVAIAAGTQLGRGVAAIAGFRLPDPRDLAADVWVTGPTPWPGARRLDRVGDADARRPLAAEDPALIVFTSGTTGAPRGIVHSSRSLTSTLETVVGLSGMGPADRVLGSGLHLTVPALLAGATVVVPPRGRPARLASVTRRLAVTHLSLPPHVAVEWAAAGGAAAGLRRLFLGSAPTRNVALRSILAHLPAGAETWSIYGMTEQLLVAAVAASERMDHDEAQGDLVGRPLPGVTTRFASDGELWVGGPGLARGVLGDPEPALELPTGDLGLQAPDGRIVLTGRRKEMIIRRGENIYPALYEARLAEAADLGAAIMVGIPAPDGDETVVLWVEPRRGEPAGRARSRTVRLLADGGSPVDAHARPDAVLAIDRIPRSGRSTKPDRRALVMLAAARLGRAVPADPILAEPG